MPYPIVSHDVATVWWAYWQETGDIKLPPLAPVSDMADTGGDHCWSDRLVPALMAELGRLYDEVEDPKGDLTNDRFEAEACIIVHRSLPTDEALKDPEFWIWMATIPGADMIRRRYPCRGSYPIPDHRNFTSSNARETLFWRLWTRGQLARDDTLEDPYSLARYGDIDFWRSHIFRQPSNQKPKVLSALARFQYPDGTHGEKRLTQAEIRELVKQMRLAALDISTGAFDDEEAEKFISEQWQAVQRSGSTSSMS